MSSLFSIAECQEAIDNLKAAMIADPGGTVGSVTIAGRSVSYRNAAELEKLVSFWQRQMTLARGAAIGIPRINPKVALFK